jgi:CheY-like chemotaxis protein
MTVNSISKTCYSVLIVEDDESIRLILKEILEDEGYEVFTAENGKVGIDFLKKFTRPCLILLDFMMPVMDGKEFMEAKRQDDLIAPIPVVLVSAFEDRSRDIGAQGFVKKPIDFDCLLKFLDKYCHRKKDFSNFPDHHP